MIRTGWLVSRRSISTILPPSGTARCTVSSVCLRSSSITGTAMSRRLSSPVALRPTCSAFAVTIQRVGVPAACRIQPAACSVTRARWTELLGSSMTRARSATPIGCRAATSSRARSALRTFCIR